MAEAPSLVLGTAMWAWTVEPKQCFSLLDRFYEAGGRQVDTATNYPINKNPEDFRKAESILAEWIRQNGIQDLEVMVKVGSINNMFTPEHNLHPSFLLLNLQNYRILFGPNLHTLMIHWDNRDQIQAIAETCSVLQEACRQGLQVGLSGIKHPELYAQINRELELAFRIQIKHNLLYSAYERYAGFHGQRRFIAYGIAAGGLRLDGNYQEKSTLKARGGKTDLPGQVQRDLQTLVKNTAGLNSFYQLGMIHAFFHPEMEGILIGPSRLEQLNISLDFYEQLCQGSYREIYEPLVKIRRGEH